MRRFVDSFKEVHLMSSSFLSGFLKGFTEQTKTIGGAYAKGSAFFNDGKSKKQAKCSYCLNVYQEPKEECPTCGAKEFI